MSVTIETGQRLALDQRLLDVSEPTQMQVAGTAKEVKPEPGTIMGTACRYSKPVERGGGLYLELVAGCFAAALRDPARVLVLWQHEPKDPIGHLLTLTDGDQTLGFTGKLSGSEHVHNSWRARDQLDEGTLSQVSVGFQIQKYERIVDEENDTVTYRVLKGWLMELSIVTWGAMEDDATVEDVFAQQSAAPPAPASEPAAARAGALQAARLRARMAGWS